MCSFTSSLLLSSEFRPPLLGIPALHLSISRASLRHCSFPRPRLLLHRRQAASRALQLSWFHDPRTKGPDDFGGWAISEPSLHHETLNKGGGRGVPFALLVAVAATAVAAVLAHFSSSTKGPRFRFSSALHVMRGLLMENEIREDGSSETADVVGFYEERQDKSAAASDAASSVIDKHDRVIVPVSVDSTQQEAFSTLKKLEIIEDNCQPDELCTKREYARWLVRANLLLERNPLHRIFPSALLPGSMIAAFDDVSFSDPDFCSIQVLAEAGIIPSKLSAINSSLDLNDLREQSGVYFLPERFVSRQNLIDWKAQLEYKLSPEIEEKIAKANVCFMDVKEIESNASPELFMDILADDNSIYRKVFGRSKRFQPNKPSTKAQAAAAVASGRMTEAICTELSQCEIEKFSRFAAMEEIKCELLGRGEIQSFWDEKRKKEKNYGLEVEMAYLAAVHDLNLEKISEEKYLQAFLKEKEAIDCQKQLLLSLKDEVDEMSERLARERAQYMAEQHDIQMVVNNLRTKQEGILDAKSLLEAEIEALRILRSWVEDEARKNQARAKVLMEVGRRWKWETQDTRLDGSLP